MTYDHTEIKKQWEESGRTLEVEFYNDAQNEWRLCNDTPVWRDTLEYRFKPGQSGIPTPHVHAEMITEWVKDTSRVVEFFNWQNKWVTCVGIPQWHDHIKYRFKPKTPKGVAYITVYEDGLISWPDQSREDADRVAVSNGRKRTNLVETFDDGSVIVHDMTK